MATDSGSRSRRSESSDSGAATSADSVTFGKPGHGKARLAKLLAAQSYDELCRSLGGELLEIGHGQPIRINPLDPRAGSER